MSQWLYLVCLLHILLRLFSSIFLVYYIIVLKYVEFGQVVKDSSINYQIVFAFITLGPINLCYFKTKINPFLATLKI